MKDATVVFLGRISDGSTTKCQGRWCMRCGFAREIAEGVGKIEIKYISRWLCFSPYDFSFATCLASGLKREGMGEFWTGGEPAPI